MSLAVPPEVKSSGAFEDSRPHISWMQPSHLWQVIVSFDQGTMIVDGNSFQISPGSCLLISPSSKCHLSRLGRDNFLYLYSNFGILDSELDKVTIPLHCDLGEFLYQFDHKFRQALHQLNFTKTPIASAVWDLLWTIAIPSHHIQKSIYTEAAQKLIDSNLDRKLSLSDICSHVKISASQLTRHFLTDLGRTPHQYILDQRATLAHSLLVNSTEQIKSVANLCGIPNVQQFNRFIHDRFGASPRELRKSRGQVDFYKLETDHKKKSHPTEKFEFQ